MGRIVCIDHGGKRCGIAVTDPLQIIATGLTAVHPKELIPFLKKYTTTEPVELILIGLPKNLNGTDTHGTAGAQRAFEEIKKALPAIPVKQIDEQFTSKRAGEALHQMGMKKSQRNVKENKDIVAATMMLQEYMNES